MKKHIYLYLVFTLLLSLSCSKEEGPGPEPETENKAPTVPSKIFPLNNTLCIDNAINFQWNASTDPEGETLRYRLEIASDANFSSIIENKSVTNVTSTIITLDKGLSFFWRVKAIDSKNAESDFSITSQFLTEGEGESNHLPFIPELVLPVLNSTISGTSTTLSWSASDADEDPLTFDVYLDTNENPTTKVSENQSNTTFQASGLSAGTTYYFKIVVKDSKEGVTIGSIWSFSTN
ncbi:fibronectin type III domain-containing protein [uncultured Polaribacter sp.]|uniref:fibronectin type III domain-containing protein n=1 Tax=uncultured Polaribacter sp. TaxID=174711 RepID=UPI0026180406|nr:fibronectin type III domain-containing protein [uncultured Polaribacter sp.]